MILQLSASKRTGCETRKLKLRATGEFSGSSIKLQMQTKRTEF